MKIIITERQLKLIERVIDNEVFCDKCNWNWSLDDGGNDPFICHKCGHDNEPKPEPEPEPNVFTYKTLGSFSAGRSRFKYFNELEPVKYDPSIPDKVKLLDINDNETYIVDKSEFKIGKDKFNNVNGRVTEEYFLKTFSLNKNNETPDNKIKPTSQLLGITPSNIRLALKKAYPLNWKGKDTLYSPGLRGVKPIGSYLNPKTDEDWSIMNFFDTKKEIHDELKLQYLLEESDENIVEWLTKVFNPVKIKDKEKKVKGEKFLDLLIQRQMKSFKSGFVREHDSVNFFLKTLPSGSKVTTYNPGEKMDRWCGVDVTINGVNYQIKPLSTFSENGDGQTVINTYNMKDYKDYNKTVNKDGKVICPGIDKIAFSNSEQSLVFDNKNYEVIKYKNSQTSNKAIFNDKPIIYNGTTKEK